MAEAMLRGLAPDFQVRSAGISATDGAPASRHAREVLGERGLDLDGHRSRTVEPADLEWADLVLTMTEAHRTALVRRYPAAAPKVFPLRSFTGGAGDVVDPYGGGRSDYERTARELETTLAEAVRRLRGG